MKNKRIAAFLLTVAMLISFASCGEKTDTGETVSPEADPGTESQAETEEPGETEEYISPGVKYDGREFIFSAWKTYNPSWVATQYFEAGAGEQDGDPINEALYYRNLQVEEELDVKIVSKEYSSATEMVAPTLAGDYYADTVLSDGSAIGSIVNQKLSIDLNTISTLDMSKSWWDQNANTEFSINKKLYFAAGTISSFADLAAFTTFFNKNMIKDYSLEDPYALVREGKWTLDKMQEMSETVATDLNGDGVMDANDRFGMSSEPQGLIAILSYGIRVTEKDENDLPVLVLNSERTANAVEKFVPLYRNKNTTLFVEDFASQYSQVYSQFMAPMFISDQLLFINNWMCVAMELRIMESDFGILPPAKLDETQDRYYVPSSESWMYYAVVPITVPDLNFTGYVMDALGYYGQKEVRSAIIDKTITNKTTRDKESEEMMYIIYENRCYDLATLFNWGGVGGMMSGFIWDDATNFASVMASNEKSILSELEVTVNNLLD